MITLSRVDIVIGTCAAMFEIIQISISISCALTSRRTGEFKARKECAVQSASLSISQEENGKFSCPCRRP